MFTTVDLLLPQPVDDPVHPLREMSPVGAEWQTEPLGGDFLGGCRVQVSALERLQAFVIARMTTQHVDRSTQQFRERSGVGSMAVDPVAHQARALEQVTREQLRLMEVTERLAHGAGEVLL